MNKMKKIKNEKKIEKSSVINFNLQICYIKTKYNYYSFSLIFEFLPSWNRKFKVTKSYKILLENHEEEIYQPASSKNKLRTPSSLYFHFSNLHGGGEEGVGLQW